MAERRGRLASRRAMPPAHALEFAVDAVESHDLGLSEGPGVGRRGYAIDEIARHRRLEAAAAHQQPDLGDLAGEVDRALSGGIAGADQRDLLAAAQLGLQRRGPVVDRASL